MLTSSPIKNVGDEIKKKYNKIKIQNKININKKNRGPI